jgi:DNA-binding response OmpR family regulator
MEADVMHSAPHPLILVLEDDPAIAALLCELLEDHGYSCMTAGSADGALRVLDAVRPTLITLDLGLPGVGGGLLLQLIRSRTELSAIPVIIISAERIIDDRLRKLSRAVLTKPFDVDQLLITTEGLLTEHTRTEQERAIGGVTSWRLPSRGRPVAPVLVRR